MSRGGVACVGWFTRPGPLIGSCDCNWLLSLGHRSLKRVAQLTRPSPEFPSASSLSAKFRLGRCFKDFSCSLPIPWIGLIVHQMLEERHKFEDEKPIRMLDDSSILHAVESFKQSETGQLQNVVVGRVGTYIYETEMSKMDSNRRIVFPTFASHWAVMVFDSNSPTKDGHGYHLTFHERAAAALSPPAGTPRTVKFQAMILDDIPEGIKWVGTTRFCHGDRMEIGRKMIEAFGSYHRIFWNCQHFARLYLSVITDGVSAFEEWTLSQASNLFLCAFLVTTPVALTNITLEIQKAKNILEHFPSGSSEDSESEQVLEASDEAITLAYNLAIEDYARNHPSELRVERRGPLREMLRRLKDGVEKGYKWVVH